MVWVMAVVAAAKGINSLVQGNKQAKAAKKAGRESAAIIREQTAEAVRRAERQQKYVMGETTAGIAASGIHMSGSAKSYRDSMYEEMERNIAWTQRAGDMQAQQALKQGGYAASAAKAQGISGAIGAAGSIAEIMYGAGGVTGGSGTTTTGGSGSFDSSGFNQGLWGMNLRGGK